MITHGPLPSTMAAVQLTGTGGPEKLVYRTDIPLPVPQANAVLIKVGAAGLNRTDVNTRLGWYGEGEEGVGWSGALKFPLIQGADVCGRIVGVGSRRLAHRLGERVVVQPCLVSLRRKGLDQWLGSERPGGFAGFVAAPAADVHPIDSALSDADLASLPCSWGTAANLIHRARLKAGETVLVTGASGGLGAGVVALARARGARPIAIASTGKRAEVEQALGVPTLSHQEDLRTQLGATAVDLVIDAVGGELFPRLLEVIRPGGRYATSGAAGGAKVTLDLRKLYLSDLTLVGATSQSRAAFLSMIGHVERGEARPLPVRAFALSDFHAAQAAFEARARLESVVVIPPP